jgi:alkanesulfonate monooxygenase SsuD/methylene tetrahydromethanopterin reductase-like flavin-dependent oxidoreductase (luciferase family)
VPDDRIVFGATAFPEPDRKWLEAAERLPIESLWQGGHVLHPSGEAITRLALITAWTERVRVGTSILLLAMYNPVIVAKQLADLDSHSRGRLSVGVGVGGEFPHEYAAVGVPVGERGRRTDEEMQILRALWSGEAVTHRGEFFTLDDVQLRPVTPPGEAGSCMQPGGPPLLVSGRKPPAMRRAARFGNGWMPYLLSPNAYARSVETINDDAARTGRDLSGFEWMLYCYCSIRKDAERARSDVAEFLGGSYTRGASEAKLDRIAPNGTPEQVAARLQEYVDVGVRHFLIAPAARADQLEVVQLAAEEVLPRLAVSGARDAG